MERLCYLAEPSGHLSWYFSRKIVPVARQVWRAFCCPGTIFIADWRGRGTNLIDGRGIVPGNKAQKRHWRSIAVQIRSKPENYHGAEVLLRAAARVRVRD
jgi:hypothetical protein